MTSSENPLSNPTETNAVPSRQLIVATGTLYKEFTFPGGVYVSLFQGMRLTEYQLDSQENNRLFWSQGETGIVNLAGINTQVSDANAFFVRHGERTQITKNPATNTEVIVVSWDQATLFPEGRHIFSPADDCFRCLTDLRRVLLNSQSNAEAENLVASLQRQLQPAPNANREVIRAEDFLNSRLDDSSAAGQLGELLSLSDSQVRRLFNKSLGCPPAQYHLHNRIGLARYLLKNSRLPLETIATRCGFSSYSTFSNQFKKQTGISPKNARF